MFFVGIDVSKQKHEAVITDENGAVIQKPFLFPNSLEGYYKLISKVREVTLRKSEIVFGMESTSHYWLALYSRLQKEGYQVHVINPIQSNALRNLFIRQAKTDPIDSVVIAEVIRFGRFSSANVPTYKLHALRELCRNRLYMVDCISDLKRKATALIDQVFPEYDKLFSDIFLVSSAEVLKKYPTPDKLLHVRKDTLAKFLLKHSGGHFGLAKAIQLIDAAQNTFGIQDPLGVYAGLISTYIKQMQFMQKIVASLDEKIAGLMAEIDSPITSISGIGSTLGAVILSEIGDISRFQSSDKLAAFAGVDPTVKQSGDYSSIKNHMSKRGSPYLRRAIWMACNAAIHSDPMFQEYYHKKRAQGKNHMVALGHVTKKMVSVVYAVLRDNTKYQPVMQAA